MQARAEAVLWEATIATGQDSCKEYPNVHLDID